MGLKKTSILADIGGMKKDTRARRRPNASKPIVNHAGLYIVTRTRNPLPDSPLSIHDESSSSQFCWTAFGTFIGSVLCLVLK